MKQKMNLNESKNKNAICCHKNYGPIFGGGNDIRISDKCNENMSSYSYFPHSYSNDKIERSQQSFTSFCGATSGFNFKIVEY